MRALILSAGLGTRLRPLTDSVPKPLLPIANKPLLVYHLEALQHAGINDILINAHHLYRQVEDFVFEYLKLHPSLRITTAVEAELLGSAGTLAENRKFFGDEEILVVYGDNLTNINYQRLVNQHHYKQGLGTVAVYREPHPETKGLVEFNPDLLIQKFLEKPKPEQVTSNYANAGIYVFSPEIFRHWPDSIIKPLDFGHHVFPDLLGQGQKLYAYVMEEFLLDIGTLDSYDQAQKLINELSIDYDGRK